VLDDFVFHRDDDDDFFYLLDPCGCLPAAGALDALMGTV